MDRHQLLRDRDSAKLRENAGIVCGDLVAAFEALKEVEEIDRKLRELKEAGAAERGGGQQETILGGHGRG